MFFTSSRPQFEMEPWDYPPAPPHFSGYYGSTYGDDPRNDYGCVYQSTRGMDNGLQYPQVPQPPQPPPSPLLDVPPQSDPLPNVQFCTLQCCILLTNYI